MKICIITLFTCLVYLTAIAQVTKKFPQKAIQKQSTVGEIQPKTVNVAVEVNQPLSRNTDTIPVKMYKHYVVDELRYRNYVQSILKDSVKLASATEKDWDDFDKINNKLSQTLFNDPHENVKHYIQQGKDFNAIGLVNRQLSNRTAKVCLRQLIFNIKLADNLLNKPLTNEADLQLLSMVITNIDTLCLAYIVPYVRQNMNLLRYPTYTFKVYDSSNTELTRASCFFVSPYVCRSVACKNCKPAPIPCTAASMDKIMAQSDYRFDCANPASLTIAPGTYHIFVVNKQRVSYLLWSTDNAVNAITSQPKTINLHIQ